MQEERNEMEELKIAVDELVDEVAKSLHMYEFFDWLSAILEKAEEKLMDKINKGFEKTDGPGDAISLDVEAMNTKFRGHGKRRRIANQQKVQGNIKASIELGVLSISDRNNEVMLTVCLEDVTTVLAALYAAALEEDGKCNNQKELEILEAAPDVDSE